MRVLHISKIVIGGMALALSSSLWANNNINTSPNNTSNQQQINKFKKDSYARVNAWRATPAPKTHNKKIDPAKSDSTNNEKNSLRRWGFSF